MGAICAGAGHIFSKQGLLHSVFLLILLSVNSTFSFFQIVTRLPVKVHVRKPAGIFMESKREQKGGAKSQQNAAPRGAGSKPGLQRRGRGRENLGGNFGGEGEKSPGNNGRQQAVQQSHQGEVPAGKMDAVERSGNLKMNAGPRPA